MCAGLFCIVVDTVPLLFFTKTFTCEMTCCKGAAIIDTCKFISIVSNVTSSLLCAHSMLPN